MYSYQEMIKAVKFYIQFRKKTALTLQTLGYPTKNTLHNWYKTYMLYGDLPKGYIRKKKAFTEQQKTQTIDYYLNNSHCITQIVRHFGYPCRQKLRQWLLDQHTELFTSFSGAVKVSKFSREQKTQAVLNFHTRKSPLRNLQLTLGLAEQHSIIGEISC